MKKAKLKPERARKEEPEGRELEQEQRLNGGEIVAYICERTAYLILDIT